MEKEKLLYQEEKEENLKNLNTQKILIEFDIVSDVIMFLFTFFVLFVAFMISFMESRDVELVKFSIFLTLMLTLYRIIHYVRVIIKLQKENKKKT